MARYYSRKGCAILLLVIPIGTYFVGSIIQHIVQKEIAANEEKRLAIEKAEFAKEQAELAQWQQEEAERARIENLLEGKNFTRTIDLVGKAVTTQINAISQRASIEIQRLEQSTVNLDRKVQLGLMSYGEAARQKREVIIQQGQIQFQTLDQKEQYQLVLQGLTDQYSANNSQLTIFEENKNALNDRLEEFRQIISGSQVIKIRNKETGQVEEKTFENLGAVFNTDYSKGYVPNYAERKIKEDEVLLARKKYAEDLAASQVSYNPETKLTENLNPNVKNTWGNLPATITSAAYENKQTEYEKASAIFNTYLDQLEKINFKLETLSKDFETGQISSEEFIKTAQTVMGRLGSVNE